MYFLKDDLTRIKDPEILKQRIELLQIELEDSKLRENSHRQMYDSLVRSFSSKNENSISVTFI